MMTTKETYLSLQHSESVVATMSAMIYAAYVQRHEVTPENEDAFIKRAVSAAVKLANYTDKLAKSDEEWMGKDSGGSVL
jgi:predicted transcriptional regulator